MAHGLSYYAIWLKARRPPPGRSRRTTPVESFLPHSPRETLRINPSTPGPTPVSSLLTYSCRITRTGSIRTACRAGREDAARVTTARTTAAPERINGSRGAMP
jgi:hypothetical protein